MVSRANYRGARWLLKSEVEQALQGLETRKVSTYIIAPRGQCTVQNEPNYQSH